MKTLFLNLCLLFTAKTFFAQDVKTPHSLQGNTIICRDAGGSSTTIPVDVVFGNSLPHLPSVQALIGNIPSKECVDQIMKPYERYKQKDYGDKNATTRMVNEACSHKLGWVEKSPGTCNAGGPPPICPVDHWMKSSNAWQNYQYKQAIKRNERVNEMVSEGKRCQTEYWDQQQKKNEKIAEDMKREDEKRWAEFEKQQEKIKREMLGIANQFGGITQENRETKTENRNDKLEREKLLGNNNTNEDDLYAQMTKEDGNIAFEQTAEDLSIKLKDQAQEQLITKLLGEAGNDAWNQAKDLIGTIQNAQNLAEDISDGRYSKVIEDEISERAKSSNPLIREIQTRSENIIKRTVNTAVERLDNLMNAYETGEGYEKAEAEANAFIENSFSGKGTEQSINNYVNQAEHTASSIFTRDNLKKGVAIGLGYMVVETAGAAAVVSAVGSVVTTALAVATCLPCLAVAGLGYYAYKRYKANNSDNNYEDNY